MESMWRKHEWYVVTNYAGLPDWFASKMLVWQNMGKSTNFGTYLVESPKAANLVKCYPKLAKILVKKTDVPTFWHAHILVY